jgi:hypothetical protein
MSKRGSHSLKNAAKRRFQVYSNVASMKKIEIYQGKFGVKNNYDLF